MQPRLNPFAISSEAYKALANVEAVLRGSSIEKTLRELVKVRASQINGCAYCIDMHWKDARAGGETEQRLYGLSAWEESAYYTERERAALAWTESATTLTKDHMPDALYEDVRKHFSEKEIVDLTFVVAVINAWNRLAIAFRAPAGTYEPGKHG